MGKLKLKIILFILLFVGIGVNNAYTFDISTSTYVDRSGPYIGSIAPNLTLGNFINNDGSKIFGKNSTTIYEYNLSTPYDISTISYIRSASGGGSGGFTFSYLGDYLYYTNISGGQGYICYKSLGTNFDITTLSSEIGCFNMGAMSTINNQGFAISSDGNHIYVNGGSSYNTLYQIDLATPFDITSGSIVYSYSHGDGQISIKISYDGVNLLYNDQNSNILRQLSLSTPYDLSTKSNIYNYNHGQAGYERMSFSQDYSKFYLSSTGDIREYNTNDSIPLPPELLEITSTGTLIALENGIEINGLNVNNDFNLDYTIYQYNGIFITEVDSGYLGTFSGGLNNISIFYDFNAFGNYDLEINVVNPDDVDDKDIHIYNIDYLFNGGFTEPDLNEFNFTTSGINFFENGFELLNFTANPSGGELYFDIIAPVSNGTGTLNITTNSFYPINIDGNGYGIDTRVNVTYPYHQNTGIYQVRVVYKYDDLVIYPFGEDYNSYTITLAELPSEYIQDINAVFICDTDLDGITQWEETIVCPFTILKYFVNSVSENLKGLKDFFIKITEIGTDEVKTFSFIQNAYASNILDGMGYIEDQNTVVSKLYYFVKGFLFLIFIILGVGLIILLKRH